MHQIWVSTDEKIASFKKIDGYKLMEFNSTDTFWEYIHSLTASGYRFQ